MWHMSLNELLLKRPLPIGTQAYVKYDVILAYIVKPSKPRGYIIQTHWNEDGLRRRQTVNLRAYKISIEFTKMQIYSKIFPTTLPCQIELFQLLWYLDLTKKQFIQPCSNKTKI